MKTEFEQISEELSELEKRIDFLATELTALKNQMKEIIKIVEKEVERANDKL